jgi:PAS domain S-box-containing protein
MVSCRDLTSGVRAERIGRIYATLAKADEAIVRVRQRLSLFEEVCRVLVDEGRLRMAWVGEIDDHGWVVPVALSGAARGYLDDIRVSVLDVPEGRGPTGIAARERHHVFTADIAKDGRMVPWRDAALARGYRSSAAFPLVVEDQCVAVLTAYASEPGFFDEEEVKLFDRMAADLSFAVEAMQREERRQALEAELRSSEERFRLASESMLDAFTILSPVRDDDGEITDFRYRYVNEAYCELVGFDRGRLLGRRVGELFPQFPDGERFELYRRVALTGEPCRTDDVQLPSTWAGTALDSRVLDTVIASMGEGLVVSARDITDRKQAEQEREQPLAELQEAQQIAQLGSWHWDPATGTRTWSPRMYAVYGRDPGGGPMDTDETFAWVDPDDLERVQKAYANMLSGGQRFELDYRLLTGDRGMRTVHAIARPDPERPGSYRGTLQDVTERKRAEEELQLRAELLDLAHDAVIVREPAESRVTFWNREAQAIYGYSPAEALGQITHELLASVFPESRQAVDDALEREGQWVGELRHTRKGGGVIIVSSRQALQRGADERPTAIIELNSDVTERKQFEAALRASEQRFRGGFENAPIGMALVGLDGRYLEVNATLARMLGFDDPAELTGQSFTTFIHPDEVALAQAAPQRVVETGAERGERRYIRSDGTVVYTLYAGTLVRNAGGAPSVFFAQLEDITERKLAEATLRASEERFRGGFENSPIGAALTGLDGRLVEVNATFARMLGYDDPAELAGQGFANIVHPDEVALGQETIKRIMEKGSYYGERRYVDRDGGVVYALYGATLVCDPDGQPSVIFGQVEDITERKRAEVEIRTLNRELEQRVAERTAELEHANRELETFAYSVSHDLRAPLRAVDGFSQALLEDYAEKLDEEGRHDLERIRAGAVRMGDLIDAILQLSRLSRWRLARVPIDISALARAVIAELEADQPDRRVEVEIQDGLFAEADLSLARTVLSNLFDNAYKFTSKAAQPQIRFGALQQDGVSVYFVADNGAGFDMARAERLFLPFHRLHRETEFPGDGIGLATVMRAVRKHGGAIWAEGVVNKGATFHFSLTPGAQPPPSATIGMDVLPTWQPTERESRQ